ncbi:MAG: GTP 3',8-cyclase MoaA [Tissierellia bacterium]|nr:GTP 3',8-cyclase MoaA [Tissierellia bacterium]
MMDQYGRKIDYIRISITDRCNLRCVYCMPEEGVEMLRHEDILSYEELLRLTEAFAILGIKKVKLTGGEPLVRQGVMDFFRKMKAIPGIDYVSITTNGVLLKKMGPELLEAGIDGINISLDTLDRQRFAELTRRDELAEVLEGIYWLLEHHYPNLKLNAVPMKPGGEEDILALAEMARRHPLHVRYIELMPIGEGKEYKGYGEGEIRQILESRYGPSEPYTGVLGSGPANYVSFPGFQGKIGFIDPISDKFCRSCNRIRLSCTGFLKLCLHHNRGQNIRPLLGHDPNPEELARQIEGIINQKPWEHSFGKDTPTEDNKRMHQIGG